MCEYCFAELGKASLAKHHKTKTCELFKTRNDNQTNGIGCGHGCGHGLDKWYSIALVADMVWTNGVMV